MTTNAEWILIASRAKARICLWDARAGKLRVLREVANPHGRLKSGELESDRPGMAFRAQGRHPMATKHPAHEHVAERFAADLAALLREARIDHRFARLLLIAEPHFIGLLRAALDAPTAALIERTIEKDLAGLPLSETEQHLRLSLAS